MRHLVHDLVDQVQALLDFRDALQVARIDVPALLDDNVELQLVVDRIGMRLAHVEGHTRRAQVGARHAVRDRLIGAQDAHALGAALEDLVLGDQLLVVAD